MFFFNQTCPHVLSRNPVLFFAQRLHSAVTVTLVDRNLNFGKLKYADGKLKYARNVLLSSQHKVRATSTHEAFVTWNWQFDKELRC